MSNIWKIDHKVDYMQSHDDVIKWKHFPGYWPFVRRIHRSPVNSPHKGQWRGALMFSLICARIYGWVNNGEAGDLRRHRAHYVVTVMFFSVSGPSGTTISTMWDVFYQTGPTLASCLDSKVHGANMGPIWRRHELCYLGVSHQCRVLWNTNFLTIQGIS